VVLKVARSYKQLTVWEKAVDLSLLVYRLTERFPNAEMYGLTSQMRRCAVSIPSNIAEGSQRHSDKDFIRFLAISKGSLAELETQSIIANKLHYLANNDYEDVNRCATEVGKMLSGLIKKLDAALLATVD
jgi:four helix bundle protein